MIRTAAAISLLFTLVAPVKADKFYFDTPNDTSLTEGNDKQRMIEGVLIKETEETYHVRIIGGEMEIAKSMVKKHEKDGLTVAQIENAEKDRADAVAKSESKRVEARAVEASARRVEPPKAPAQQEKNLLIEVDFQSLLPGYSFRTFDPVLRRANITGLRQVIEDYLRAEVKAAAHRK